MNQTVTQILSDKYGISAKLGKKGECPFCHHMTFSIKRGDKLGKCFHPNCGKYINSYKSSDSFKTYLTQVFENIFHDFHQALLDLKNAKPQNGYTYLIDERHIHPEVVSDSMLGVVPSNYNLDSQFESLVSSLNLAIDEEREKLKGKQGRPPKKDLLVLEEKLDFYDVTKEKLRFCVQGSSGWLCFFYTNAHHKITSIRFRKPYSQDIKYFKPFNYAGLFGHNLFSPFESEEYIDLNDFLIVTEGEFNQLQLQSLSMKYWESQNFQGSFLNACSVGGVNNADLNTIARITKRPIFFYDNDDAGFQLVRNAQNTMHLSATTTPQPDSDLDEYILSFEDDYNTAWKKVKILIKSRKKYFRDCQGVAAEIYNIRKKQHKGDIRREFEINNSVAKLIYDDLKDRGVFYHEGELAYYFLESEKRLITIDSDNNQFAGLLFRFGINRAENLFKYLLFHLYQKAVFEGARTEVHRLSYYDPQKYILYLSNHNNGIYRISAKEIELVDNGTDGVLFVDEDWMTPFELVFHDSNISLGNDNISFLDDVIISRINFETNKLHPGESRFIFTLWLCSLFFESIMPSKLILAFIGPKGGGKSITLRKIGILLFGEKFDVTPLPEDQKDFDAAVTNSHYVVIDNADSKCKWLNDRLATVATGGNIKRRALYTTNKLIDIPTRCFLAITSRTPGFRRDDVADRLLLLKLERLNNFISSKTFYEEIIEHRNEIMTEVIRHLQDIIRA
jgi:hypothetical protein